MTVRPTRRVVAVLPLVALVAACGGPQDAAPPAAPGAATAPAASASNATATPAEADAPIPATASPLDALPTAVRQQLDQPFTGDFDAMVKRRADSRRGDVQPHALLHRPRAGARHHLRGAEVVRDRPQHRPEDRQPQGARGAACRCRANQLPPALAKGTVDMVAAMVTVRPELEELAAFSEPTRTDVSQVVVTGPGAPPIATVDDLAGQAVFVRKTSPYSRDAHPPERAAARRAASRPW